MGCLSCLFPPRLARAELVVTSASGSPAGRRIGLQFILGSYKLWRQNSFAELAAPGLPGTPLQFLHGQPKRLSLALYFDARSEGISVRGMLDDVANLMRVEHATRAPPVLRFEWQGLELTCVLESAREEILSLFPDGKPARARMYANFKESRTVTELQHERDIE